MPQAVMGQGQEGESLRIAAIAAASMTFFQSADGLREPPRAVERRSKDPEPIAPLSLRYGMEFQSVLGQTHRDSRVGDSVRGQRAGPYDSVTECEIGRPRGGQDRVGGSLEQVFAGAPGARDVIGCQEGPDLGLPEPEVVWLLVDE